MRSSKMWLGPVLCLVLLWGCSPDPTGGDPCEEEDCSGHGTCEAVDGVAVCVCDERYSGDECSECADGYSAVGADCVQDDPCAPDPCDPNPCAVGDCTCDETTGEAVCSCDPDPCDPDPCAHGSCSCDSSSGGADCACDAGWTGDLCDECEEGYVPDGDECVPCNELAFYYTDSSASSVWVTGSFTDWADSLAGGAIEMTDDGTGSWGVTTAISPGGRHTYKFVIDGGARWEHDPLNPQREDDGHGGFNSVIEVCDFGGGACGDLDEFDWRDVVMYFVMVDRFRDSDSSRDTVGGATDGPPDGASGQYMGGDLPGVTERLDYLADLGVTAIWLSAPYDNRDGAGAAIDPARDTHMYSGYHGYWPSPENVDYSDPTSPSPRPLVESRIGTGDDLATLVETAHGTTGGNGHAMRVLFDYVMNHVDIDSALYRAHEDDDWFARRPDDSFALCGPENLWDDPVWGTRCAFTDYLPPFDFEVTGPRDWSVADAMWWAVEYGIDGYRLDAIKHVPLVWLTDLRAAIEEAITPVTGERFYLVGETFAYDDPGLIRSFVDPDTMLDGQFDFPFKARLCEAVFTEGGSLSGFSEWVDGNDGFYGSDSIMTTWIGNHDIPRAIHFASREIGNCREGSSPENGWSDGFGQPGDAAPYERLGVAFAVMMTSPGIPLLYYGDEVGLAGGGDPDNRRMMPWSDAELNAHQIALREAVAALAGARGESRALSRGRRTTLSADQDTWVYRMGGCGASAPDVVVAVNRADGELSLDIPAGSYTDLLDGGAHAGGSTTLAARSYLLLQQD